MKVVLRSSSLLFFLVNLFLGLRVTRRPVATKKNVGSSLTLASPPSSHEGGEEPSLDVRGIA